MHTVPPSPHRRTRTAQCHLLIGFLMTMFALLPVLKAAERPFIIVSVGDSVGSGEGAPDIPRKYEPNPNFNPVKWSVNADFDPSPLIPNPNYDPSPGEINVKYDPSPKRINPNFQPFPVPDVLRPLLPSFPPYNPTLLQDNPNYSPTLFTPNPSFDPLPVLDNADFDPNPLSDTKNPDYDPEPWLITEAVWDSEPDHRSKWAGPAQAARELIQRHPEVDVRFMHLAKSGANIQAVKTQVETALAETGGRIDVLMISAGGNNVGTGGFGTLIEDVIQSAGQGTPPSQNVILNAVIRASFSVMAALFDDLAVTIDSGDVGEVFITEYFDMTRNSDGSFAFPEADWVYNSIIVPLNRTIAAAARRHGWHYVGGIADQFQGHGYFASPILELEPPVLVNPDFNPLPSLPNAEYDPFAKLPNPHYNPVRSLPNLNYNPVRNKPNLQYDPLPSIPNPHYNPLERIPNPKYDPVKEIPVDPLCFIPGVCPFKANPNYDPRLTLPNPSYDPRLTIPNPSYDPRLTVPNPDYDPSLTVPNPDFDDRLTVSNPNYDKRLTLPNPNFDPKLTTPNPAYQDPATFWTAEVEYGQPLPPGLHWVVRVEDSFLLQGDKYGSVHPNYWGHAVFRDRLVEDIERTVSIPPRLDPPTITSIERLGDVIRLHVDAAFPSDRLFVESSRDLDRWQEDSVTFEESPEGSWYVDYEVSEAVQRYFRVGCR